MSAMGTPEHRDPPGRSDRTEHRPMPTIRLRNARPDDATILRTWDQDPDVIAADAAWETIDDDWDWDAELARSPHWREQLVIEELTPTPNGIAIDHTGTPDVGRPVGFVQIIDPADEESHYWGSVGPGHRAIDIWIGAPADRGRGIGAAAMRLALARCGAAPGVHTVLIDPLATNRRAIAFYQRLGFEHVDRHREPDAPRPADAGAVVLRWRVPGRSP